MSNYRGRLSRSIMDAVYGGESPVVELLYDDGVLTAITTEVNEYDELTLNVLEDGYLAVIGIATSFDELDYYQVGVFNTPLEAWAAVPKWYEQAEWCRLHGLPIHEGIE